MNRQTVGFVGSALLVVGVFTPLIVLPLVGGVNYFQHGEGDGKFVLILGVLSAMAVRKQRYRALWLTGIASLALVTSAFVSFRAKLAEAKASMAADLGGSAFREFSERLVGPAQLSWGFAVLVIGAVMLLAAASMKPDVSVGNTG